MLICPFKVRVLQLKYQSKTTYLFILNDVEFLKCSLRLAQKLNSIILPLQSTAK